MTGGSAGSGEHERPHERPRPQYGEYATPEEVAEARGPLPVEPTDPVSRLAAPISGPPSTRAERAGSRATPGLSSAPPPRGDPVAVRHPRQANNMITALLIVVGIWNTVTSVPSYLDFGPALTQGLELAGYGTVSFGAAAHTAGIVLLVISCLLLLAATGVSLQLIRSGRRSIWVPVVAAALYLVASLAVMTAVVANTPALLGVLQNH
ncbi:MAG: DUF6264 family protein [Pseudolysinimonas sp.]